MNTSTLFRPLDRGREALAAAFCGARRPPRGFSLIELLVVLAVIGLLTAMVLPALNQSRAASELAVCQSNLQQLFQANVLYASANGSYVPAAADIYSGNLERWHGRRKSLAEPFLPEEGPLADYLGANRRVRACPAFREYDENGFEAGCGGYGYNAVGVGSRAYLLGMAKGSEQGMSPVAIASPARTVMFCDTAYPRGSGLIEYSFAEPYKQLADNRPEETYRVYPSIHFRHGDRANVVWCDGHVSSEGMTFSAARGAFARNHIGWFGFRNNELFDPF